MEFYKYKAGESKTEKCGFEIFNKTEKGTCNQPAIGQTGRGRVAIPLCKDHFNYAFNMSGKHPKEMKEL